MNTRTLLLLCHLLLAGVSLRAQSGLDYLHHFGPRPSDGFWPNPLATASDGAIHGTTDFGGTDFAGLLFRVNRDGSGFTNLIHFSLSGAADGTNASPAGRRFYRAVIGP